MLKPEQEDSFSDIEKALETLRPVDLSDLFWDSIEARLNQEEPEGFVDNTIKLSTRGRLISFPFRRVASSAAMLIGVVGLGVWGYSTWTESSQMDGGIAVALTTAAPSLNKISSLGDRARTSTGGFRLVNMERRMTSVKPVEVVAQDDGSLARRVKYSYTDEYCWEDEDANTAFIELRPHEEVVSMELAVY